MKYIFSLFCLVLIGCSDVSSLQEGVLAGHRGAITNFDLNEKQNLILTSSSNKEFKVWNTNTHEFLFDIKHDDVNFDWAYFSENDDKIIAENVRADQAFEFGIKSGEFLSLTEDTRNKSWASDKKTYLRAKDRKEISIISTASDKVIDTIGNLPYNLDYARYSPSGNLIYSRDETSVLRVWRAGNKKLLLKIKPYEEYLFEVKFNKEETIVATAGKPGAHIYSLLTGELLHNLDAQTDSVFELVFSPDEKHVLTGGADGTAYFWDVETGEIKNSFADVKISEGYFSEDKKYYVATNHNYRVFIFDMVKRELVRTIKVRGENSRAWFPQGQEYVAIQNSSSRGRDYGWKIFETSTGRSIQAVGDDDNQYKFFNISKNGNLAFSVDESGTNKIWNTKTGKVYGSIGVHTDKINVATFTSDENFIVTGSDDYTIRFTDLRPMMSE